MAEYKKCPYCNHKNLASNGICAKCNRLLDGQTNETPSPKKKKDFSFLFTLIRLFIFFFVVISLAVYIFDKHPELLKKPVKDTYKEESFIKKMASINYDPNYIENKLIPVKDYSSTDPFKLINKNGQIIVDNIVNYIGDYNSFHVITKKSNNNTYYYIVNNVGETLYKTKNKINYYPATNSWVVGDKLYHDNKEIKDNIRIEDKTIYSGHYFAFVDEDEQGIINYEGNISYKSKTNEYNHFVLETTDIYSENEDNYCLINDNYNYLVVNCDNGEVKIDSKNVKLHEILPKIYYQNNKIFYINKRGKVETFETKKSIEELNIEYLDDEKVLIDEFVYDDKTDEKKSINELDVRSLSYKNIEGILNIQKEYCLNINILNYGLKYDNKQLIPCEYDSIIYFNNSIMQALRADQKIYVIVNKNKKNSLYDVKNNAVLIDTVLSYSPYSIFLKYKEGNKYYIYNIITNEKIETPENTSFELHSNYFMIEKYSEETTDTIREYYNSEFKNIYLGK